MVVVSAVAFRGKGTAVAWCAEIVYAFESSPLRATFTK